MKHNNISDYVHRGEKIFFKETSSLLQFLHEIKPGSIDDFTHYIYFDKELNLFFEYNKIDKKTRYINISRVKEIIKEIEKEQHAVQEYLNY